MGEKNNGEDDGKNGKEFGIMNWNRSIGCWMEKVAERVMRRLGVGAGGRRAIGCESGVAPASRASRRTPNGALILPEPVWARVGIVGTMSFTSPGITIKSDMRALTEAGRKLDSSLTSQGWSRLIQVNPGKMHFNDLEAEVRAAGEAEKFHACEHVPTPVLASRWNGVARHPMRPGRSKVAGHFRWEGA